MLAVFYTDFVWKYLLVQQQHQQQIENMISTAAPARPMIILVFSDFASSEQ